MNVCAEVLLLLLCPSVGHKYSSPIEPKLWDIILDPIVNIKFVSRLDGSLSVLCYLSRISELRISN